MAINQGMVDLGAIIRFIDYLKAPNQGDVLSQLLGGGGGGAPQANPFEAALATPGQVAQGAQAGPTREAAAIGAAASQQPQPAQMGSRQLLQRLLQNPRLVADLSTDNFNKLIDVNAGLAAIEPEPPKPSPEMTRLGELQTMGFQVPQEQILQTFGFAPEDTTALRELGQINADRKAQGLTPYGVEEGLTLLANLKKTADTSVNVAVSPQINIDPGTGDIISAFMTKETIDKQNSRLLELEPTIEQLQRAQKLLSTPGAGRLIASPIVRGVASGAAAVESFTGLPALSQFGVTPEELGQNIATLKSGVSSAAAQIAKIYENDLSEPTRKRLEELAQIGDLTSNPDQALGAINELLKITQGLQQETARALQQGGPRLNEPSGETPQTRVDFNSRVNAEATRLLRANPSKYPGGRKDPQLLLDAIQAADRAAPTPRKKIQEGLESGGSE